MNDKEILKKLAEAIVTICFQPVGIKQCRFCRDIVNNIDHNHKPDCPVLLAEQILKEAEAPNISCKPFSKEHIKEIAKSRVNLEKKPMKLYELQHYVDKLIEQGHSDTSVYFDTEAKTYDCHIVPIGSINLVSKEFIDEDYIILNEYIEKPEQPEIVHNVLKYKGEYYLKQVATNNCISCALYNKTDCYITGNMCCGEGFNWKSFKDIQITDELACMRKDIGDIYLTYENKIGIILYSVRGSRLITSNYDDSEPIFNESQYIRLATAEEIKEYMEKNNG